VVPIPAGARTRVLYALRRAHQTAEAAKEERLRPSGGRGAGRRAPGSGRRQGSAPPQS